MNYLAHAYLSFNDPEILVGNMISDFVKGKQKDTYAVNIRKGIMLHRAIDGFTDTHPATSRAKEFFRPFYRLYSGAFVDIVYDHFLANDSLVFAETEWSVFAKNTYRILDAYAIVLPPRFAAMLPYMKQQDWLFNYRYKWGIENSFRGLTHRAQYMDDSKTAFEIFEKKYALLQDCYNEFMPDVIRHAKEQFRILFQ